MSLPIDSALPDDFLDSADLAPQDELMPETMSPTEQMSGSQDAADSLATFFGQIAPQARRFAMSLVRRWNEAEELVQESFLRLAQREKREAVGSATARKGFLFTTIRNLAIDDFRRQQKRPRANVNLDHLGSAERQPNLERMEAVVDQSLQEMNDQWSDALQLKLNGGLSYAEIATVLEATPDQVRGWIYRGRQALAAALQDRGLLGDKHD